MSQLHIASMSHCLMFAFSQTHKSFYLSLSSNKTVFLSRNLNPEKEVYTLSCLPRYEPIFKMDKRTLVFEQWILVSPLFPQYLLT